MSNTDCFINHLKSFGNHISEAANQIKTSSKAVLNSSNSYDINGKKLIEERLLSEGGFGFVYLVRDPKDGKQYALKKIVCQNRESYLLAKKEVEVLESLPDHPNIVKCHGHCIQSCVRDLRTKEVCVLLDFCDGGHLLDLLNEHDGQLPTKLIIKVMRDVLCAVDFLHSQEPEIQHRDLKIENILRDSGGFKVCDFGSFSTSSVDLSLASREEILKLQDDIDKNTTMMYRAPEMINLYCGSHLSGKVDMWMSGCILFTLLCNRHPFQDESSLAISNARYILNEKAVEVHPRALIDLCHVLLAVKPEERPSAREVLNILCNWSAVKDQGLVLPKTVIKKLEREQRLYGFKGNKLQLKSGETTPRAIEKKKKKSKRNAKEPILEQLPNLWKVEEQGEIAEKTKDDVFNECGTCDDTWKPFEIGESPPSTGETWRAFQQNTADQKTTPAISTATWVTPRGSISSEGHESTQPTHKDQDECSEDKDKVFAEDLLG